MQTNFTVSNTDVITMLVVKQREQLELKREQLRLEWISIKDSMEKKAIESYNKQLKKLNPKVVESFTTLVSLLNPKKKFEVGIGNNSFYYFYPEKGLNYETQEVEIQAIFNDKDDYYSICEENRIYAPCKIKIKIQASERAKELIKQIDKIDSLLKNENKLKQKLIAQVTENAIKNLPEIQSLVNTTGLITLN